jgi:tetratricopeptide (TPR) repeat protein
VSDVDPIIRNEIDRHRADAEAAEEATLWREAVDAYESALTAIARTPAADGLEEGVLLTGLGRCYWNLAEARTAWRILRRAISIAQDHHDGPAQARATVEILRIWGPPERHRQMAEDALAAIGDDDVYLEARLLMELGWREQADGEETSAKHEQAMALAEEHGFEDILVSRVQQRAWQAMDAGRLDEALTLSEEVHVTCAQLKLHNVAAGCLRGAGFNLVEAGRIDEGSAIAKRSVAYATDTHLLFNAQLALMDVIGVVFARGDYDECQRLLDGSPGDSDFRADLYRMWIAEARGDTEGALRLMVDPDRGGKTPTAVGQIHAAAAGTLYRAGKHDAARAALTAWFDIDRGDREESLWEESAPLVDCLVALGDDDQVRRVLTMFERRDARGGYAPRFSVLQGRAIDPVRGAISARLGMDDEAASFFQDGIAFCESQRLPADLKRCHLGLTGLAASREPTGPSRAR